MITGLTKEMLIDSISNSMYSDVYDMSYYEYQEHSLYNQIIESINKRTNNFIGFLSVKNNGEYGFVNFNGETVFCHNSICENFSQLDKELVIVTWKAVKKGKRGYKLIPFNEIPKKLIDNIYNILRSNIQKEENERKAEKEAAKKTAIKNLGIDPEKIKVKVISENYNYGGKFKAEYDFGEKITESQFKNYLELEGRVAEAEPCFGGYSPEVVNIKTKDHIKWTYEWLGGYTD